MHVAALPPGLAAVAVVAQNGQLLGGEVDADLVPGRCGATPVAMASTTNSVCNLTVMGLQAHSDGLQPHSWVLLQGRCVCVCMCSWRVKSLELKALVA